jgi:hypothetical protein
LNSLGYPPFGAGPSVVAESIRSDVARWGTVIKGAGISVDLCDQFHHAEIAATPAGSRSKSVDGQVP